MGFERLLIELGRLFAAREEAVAADRAENGRRAIACTSHSQRSDSRPISRARGLLAQRPLRISAWDSLALSYEAFLEPGPVVGRRLLVEVDEPRRERLAQLVGEPVAAQAAEVFVNAEQRERPGAGRRGFRGGGQGLLEQPHAPELQIAPLRAADAGAERPGRAAERVVGAVLFQPVAIEAQEIAEAAVAGVEGVVQERGVGRRRPLDFRRILVKFFQQHRQDQARALSSRQ